MRLLFVSLAVSLTVVVVTVVVFRAMAISHPEPAVEVEA
jgi:hypothetical protein